ncbi:MAG: hypothetical protein QNJ36_10635 [Calothrix sp. MO_167.B42]|nr:hypothetical protein [Calothrix sp. MO_167.B42]
MAQLGSEEMAEGLTFLPDLTDIVIIEDGYAALVTEVEDGATTDITDIAYVAPTENQASVVRAKVEPIKTQSEVALVGIAPIVLYVQAVVKDNSLSL